MPRHGITRDTGFIPSGELPRVAFEETDVRRDMAIIRNGLHCDPIRVTPAVANPEALLSTCAFPPEVRRRI